MFGMRRRRLLPSERNFHEGLTREHPVIGSSDRRFGLTIAAALALLGVAKLLTDRSAVPWLAAALLFAAFAMLAPRLLAPLNRSWLKLGTVLYRIVNPVVMAILFFGLITPMAVLLRLSGRRPLSLGWERDAATYWLAREPRGPAAQTMNRQY
jgi:hypothetical protein